MNKLCSLEAKFLGPIASHILRGHFRSKHVKASEQLDDGCDVFKMGIATLCIVLSGLTSLTVGHFSVWG